MARQAFVSALCFASAAQVDSLQAVWENETSITRFLGQGVPKVFFVVGLEGSGVPVLQGLWTGCYIRADEPQQHVIGLPLDWTRGANWGHRAYGDVRARVGKVKSNDVYALPFWAVPSSCGPGGHEGIPDTFHPDLLWVKHAVEDAGAALHVVFVSRALRGSLGLLRGARHRERNCTAQAAALARQAKYLARQFESIGGAILSCFDYTSDADVKAEIHSVFGDVLPAMDEELEKHDKAMAMPGSLSDEESEGVGREVASLNKACRAMPKFTMDNLKQLVQKGHGNVDWLRSAKGQAGQGN